MVYQGATWPGGAGHAKRGGPARAAPHAPRSALPRVGGLWLPLRIVRHLVGGGPPGGTGNINPVSDVKSFGSTLVRLFEGGAERGQGASLPRDAGGQRPRPPGGLRGLSPRWSLHQPRRAPTSVTAPRVSINN